MGKGADFPLWAHQPSRAQGEGGTRWAGSLIRRRISQGDPIFNHGPSRLASDSEFQGISGSPQCPLTVTPGGFTVFNLG